MDAIKGDILLVGEGNFSFSVAFAKKYLSESSVSITSTSLLDEDSLFRLHQSAPENIECIKKAGTVIIVFVDIIISFLPFLAKGHKLLLPSLSAEVI